MTQTLKQFIGVSDTINELHRIFDLFNEKLFENKLESPMIIIQSNKRRTLGTFSVNRIWENIQKNTENRFEITLSAERLNRPIDDICATLLHEMVHLFCEVNNIKDTSNNNVYHNKNFKNHAESHGLIIEHAKTIGWSVTTLPSNTKDLIKTFKINDELFKYYRKGKVELPKIKVSEMTPKEKLAYLKDKRATLENKLDNIHLKIEELETKVKDESYE